MIFETFAWCENGDDCPKFYEGLKWVYEKRPADVAANKTGTSTIKAYSVKEPSTAFKKAFEKFLDKYKIKPCK
jgi:hypothetical protein